MMGNGGSMLFGSVFMWVVWILVAIGLAALIKTSLNLSDKRKEETALDILKKRYVRNEIAEEEFKRLRKELEDK